MQFHMLEEIAPRPSYLLASGVAGHLGLYWGQCSSGLETHCPSNSKRVSSPAIYVELSLSNQGCELGSLLSSPAVRFFQKQVDIPAMRGVANIIIGTTTSNTIHLLMSLSNTCRGVDVAENDEEAEMNDLQDDFLWDWVSLGSCLNATSRFLLNCVTVTGSVPMQFTPARQFVVLVASKVQVVNLFRGIRSLAVIRFSRIRLNSPK
jgi:hypothetical protein